MSEPTQCPDCGAEIPPSQPKGLCPRCALKGALELADDDSESTAAMPVVPETGERIGRYKLLERIGEGGCGIVYMAEQEEPVRRRVALKVIKPGMDSREVIARFEAERQALALMEHPHIARVFDGGATESGRPYFVMELVRGLRITDYCDQKNLSTRQRLDLFMQVCQAVQHAHQKGVIHRDLKSSNILVTVNDGVPVPKVIDFGIAKATGQRLTDKTLFTKFHQLIGTPAYMSPEQAEMTSVDIDTRSDIYSLGVLLYELLTGRPPFDAKELLSVGLEEMLQTIREKEPARPSTRLITLDVAEQTTVARQRQTDAPKLIQLLRGDLDWIVMKCLEKDRARRYETANGLASDVHRHLNNDPVLARPPSNLYRFQKTVRRHKLAFAAAGAIVVSLVLGLAATTVMFFKEQAALGGEKAARAQVAQQKSEVELKKAELERKNAEFRAMLVAAARSDRVVAEGKLWLGQEREAFAHLARACEYDPASTLAAEKAIAALGVWNHELPTLIFAGHGQRVFSAQFGRDGTRIVTTSEDGVSLVWEAATGKTLATLAGHGAQFSPDGTRIVTMLDRTALIWEATTGKKLVTFVGDAGKVRSAQFSPDGTRIVTILDRTAQIWEAATGKTLVTFVGHAGEVRSAQFSPDGTHIVTTTDGAIRVWDAVTGKTLSYFGDQGVLPLSVQFSPDGTRIVTTSDPTTDTFPPSRERTARVWSTSTGKMLAILTGHAGEVWTAHFSPDGTHIVTASADKTARVWDAANGEMLVTLVGHTGEVRGAQFSPDSKRIITISLDKTARLWDAATSRMLATLAGHGDRVVSAQFSADGTRIVTASLDKTARVWAVPAGETPVRLSAHEQFAMSAQFSADGTRIVTASLDKTARVWAMPTGQALATLAGHEQAVMSAQFSPGGTRIVTASRDKTARVWDSAKGQMLVTLTGHAEEVCSAEFSPDGARIVTSSRDQSARVWDAATGKNLATLGNAYEGTDYRTQVATIAQFSPDGTRILTASRANTARVWDAATATTLTTLVGHTGILMSALFSPDGTRIVTASLDKTARVWDATTGSSLATLAGHEQPVMSARFSPDGTRIVTASYDNPVRVWDAVTGKPLATLTGHAREVWSAEFSPNGTRIVTASMDKSVRVWDAITGEMLATLAGHEGSANHAQFSPDGTHIITLSSDKTVCIWNLLPPGADPAPEWFPDFLRYKAQMRLNSDGELEALKPAEWLALRERLRGVLRASAAADTPYLRSLRKYVRE